MTKIKVGIVDDHPLLIRGFVDLINSLPEFEVVLSAQDGQSYLDCLIIDKILPDIVLLDIRMPRMNGIEAAEATCINFPNIKMIALTDVKMERSVLRMIRSGCCAYLPKDFHPDELKIALKEVYNTGRYNRDFYNTHYRHLIEYEKQEQQLKLTNHEIVFLQLICTDLTSDQIAQKMFRSPSSIDKYRKDLFEKFHVKSRSGLMIEAIRRNLVSLDTPQAFYLDSTKDKVCGY